MRHVANLLKLAVVLVVAQFLLPSDKTPTRIVSRVLRLEKPVQTVSLDEAMARVDASKGKPTVSVLYLTFVPSFLKKELATDVKRWQASGAVVHAFSIDAVGNRGEIPSFARSLGKDVPPVWIQMPEGAACALKQLEAVIEFSGIHVAAEEEIPLLTLVLRDAGGNILKRKSVIVPNGGEFDPQELEHVLAPFDLVVRRALR